MAEESFEITRRDFIKVSGLSALALSLNALSFKELAAEGPKVSYPYRSWEDIYRQKWRWDRVVKGTHNVSCAYNGPCSFNVYVKGGVVWREEQAADYPQLNPRLPDFNPRGCQKGCCFSARMYDPGRIRYPLKRVGKRGEGKWRRISWEQALNEIADTLIEVITQEGPDRVLQDFASQGLLRFQAAGVARFFHLLDAPRLLQGADNGDEDWGHIVAFGSPWTGSSHEDLFYSDIHLIWAGNPVYTHISNAHFFNEARYHGTKIVSICPDYNPSAIHADLWIPINIGTDAALGLGMAQVIVAEKLYKAPFLQEQTDLPFLVREDTKRFLRESDLKAGGAGDRFYVFDRVSRRIRLAPQRGLRLGGLDPALEGEWEVKTLQGRVKVRPAFERLKERLREYEPQQAARICGVAPEVIRQLAREIAQARTASYICNWTFSKFHHGGLIERAEILVFALCGHIGRRGCGRVGFSAASTDPNPFNIATYPSLPLAEGKKVWRKQMEELTREWRKKGYTEGMISTEMAAAAYKKGSLVSPVMFWYVHGGWKEVAGRTREWDPSLPREVEEYMQEALEKGWRYVEPKPGKDPRAIFSWSGNMFRRARMYSRLIEVLLPKLKLLVEVDWRMSNTGRYADYILPAAAYYESDDLQGYPMGLTYVGVYREAVRPLGESKTEWQIACLLARAIQKRARERGILTFKDRGGQERRLDNLYDELTYGRRYTEENYRQFLADCVKLIENLDAKSWEEVARRGHARLTSTGKMGFGFEGYLATDFPPDDSATHFTWHTEKKQPWPTMTRRIQTYVDHELYLELGEELPCHKDSPKAGGHYPLQITGGHTRWSIHTMWRDHKIMLHLQRGEPILYMSVADARARGIRDGELVRVRNDLGSLIIHAKVSPAVRPGQVITYHAWEPFQHREGKSHVAITPSPINPIELAGGDYFQLRARECAEPSGNDRDTRVEVEKL